MKKIRRKIYNISKKTGDRLGFDLPYFVENGFWMLLSQAVVMVAGLATSMLFARFFEKEIYGQYQLVLSIIAFFSFFSVPGLNPALIRSIAKGNEGDLKLGVSRALRFSPFGSLFLVGVAVYYFFKSEELVAFALLLSAVVFPFLFSFDKWQVFLKGKEQFEKFTKHNILITIGKTVLIVSAIVLFRNYLLPVVAAYLFGTAFFHIVLYLRTKKEIKNNQKGKDTLQYAGFITKLGILNTVVNHFDKILIGILDIKMLAVYAISLGLINIIKNFIKSAAAITFPKFAKHNISLSVKQILILLFFGIILTGILFFIADDLIRILYTDKYLKSAYYFKLFVLIVPLFIVSSVLSKKVLARKNEKILIHLKITIPVITLLFSVTVYLFTKKIEYFIFAKFFCFNILNFIILILPEKKDRLEKG
ncbi:MAG: oligosaccharide flippase family protein [Bacteroidales bacterium]|nr:oligosaccharide flippase family protein [Bacteroidales bacterium]